MSPSLSLQELQSCCRSSGRQDFGGARQPNVIGIDRSHERRSVHAMALIGSGRTVTFYVGCGHRYRFPYQRIAISRRWAVACPPFLYPCLSRPTCGQKKFTSPSKIWSGPEGAHSSASITRPYSECAMRQTSTWFRFPDDHAPLAVQSEPPRTMTILPHPALLQRFEGRWGVCKRH